MQIIKIDPSGDMMAAIERGVAVLQRGGTCIFPTDTVYGLGCNALDARAVGRVFDIKHRSYVSAMPILVRDISWARELAYISPEQEHLIKRLWPGKITFVLARRPIVPATVCGGGTTVGLRAPGFPFLQLLLQHLGYPLVGTSANISGNDSVGDGKTAVEIFGSAAPQPDLLIDAGHLPPSDSSTVVDLSGNTPRILRQGAVRADKILALL